MKLLKKISLGLILLGIGLSAPTSKGLLAETKEINPDIDKTTQQISDGFFSSDISEIIEEDNIPNCNCSNLNLFTHPACIPDGYVVDREERNEDGEKPITYVGYNKTTLLKHATLFNLAPAMAITHVCVNAKPPSNDPLESFAYVFFAHKDPLNNDFPDSSFHRTYFKIICPPTHRFHLVKIEPPETISGDIWVGVEYPTATEKIGHQGVRSREFGRAAVFVEKRGEWIEYDSTGNDKFIHSVPSIGIENCKQSGIEEIPREVTPKLGDIVTSGTVRIDYNFENNGEIKVLDAAGKQVYSKDVSAGNGGVLVHDLSAGVYFVRELQEGYDAQQRKLILTR